ncbi:MAG: GGDEF domain-containing protein [Clostridia bacterium]|nr:GGDEF domain-containing protein [Clostridia bacterium]
MSDTRREGRRSIPIQTVIICMVAVGLLISIILMAFMYQTSKSYGDMRYSTKNYIDCQGIASDLLTGSDALTIYARGFVVTGDKQQVELYYGDTQARNAIDEALAEVRAYSMDERVLSQLNNAMQLRERVSATEEYAMRLKVAALGDDVAEYPKNLQDIQLLPADTRLSPEEQEEKARGLLFDMDYESSKNEISLRINRGMDVLMSGMLTRQVESSDHLLNVLRGQQILTVALMCALLALAVVVFTMVIVPLRRQISMMSSDEALSEEGASEIQFLARTYNQLHEQNRLATEKLNYEATHDELTGLFNRSAYADALERAIGAGEKVALILLDVDLFKSINDRYGHDIGDAVLRAVADTVRSAFRRDDMVCRIGGDEFAVVMSEADSGVKPLVRSKLQAIAARLKAPGDGLPPVTLSAGVAFTDQLIPGTDLFKSADLALYAIKNGTRNGSGFASAAGGIETIPNAEG